MQKQAKLFCFLKYGYYIYLFLCLHNYTILLQTLGKEHKPRFSSTHRNTSQQKFTHSDSLRASILYMISLRKTGISQALLKAHSLPPSLSCLEQWLKSCISINTGLDTVSSTCYIIESGMSCSETTLVISKDTFAQTYSNVKICQISVKI